MKETNNHSQLELTQRQHTLLTRVVEEFVHAGQPVGSRALANSGDLQWGPSTIRSELASLEQIGLLAHPHTSAGRVPTDAGYRYFVNWLLSSQTSGETRQRLELTLIRQEVDEAMRATTETLSRLTDLIAVASAPPLRTTTVKHIELLVLQPQMLMVVVITSSGGVSKRIFRTDRPIDHGLINWASSYLKEQLVGLGIGARVLNQRLIAEGLAANERQFLDLVAPVFLDLQNQSEDQLYFEGAAKLIGSNRAVAVEELSGLLELLEQRAALLNFLKQTLTTSGDLQVRIGSENKLEPLQSLAVVAANYGLPNRSLGTISVIGPTWMDYQAVISYVRSAADELSSFMTDIYS